MERGAFPAPPAVGVAYSDSVRSFLRRHGEAVDYVEVPFELLRHDPSVIGVRQEKPVVLHCASLSIAGTVPCLDKTILDIKGWVERTGTPWIGEHLAFVTASAVEAGGADQYAPGEPYNIGYTVSPPMNDRALKRVIRNLESYQRGFDVPLLIENSPLYFRVPGSMMSQAEFISAICGGTNTGLLLDLAHFYITSQTMQFNPFEELLRLPLERVVEIHISGVDRQPDGCWDDHARTAPAVVHELLRSVLERARPRAITLEYNWSSRFPDGALLQELARVREAVGTVAQTN